MLLLVILLTYWSHGKTLKDMESQGTVRENENLKIMATLHDTVSSLNEFSVCIQSDVALGQFGNP